jgi:hypothetical protein
LLRNASDFGASGLPPTTGKFVEDDHADHERLAGLVHSDGLGPLNIAAAQKPE